MELQLIEAYVPQQHFQNVDASLKDFPSVSYWISNEPIDRTHIRILVDKTKTEDILNYLEKQAKAMEGFEVLLFPVQTYIARLTEEEKKQREKTKEEDASKLQRVSRQELLGTIKKTSNITLNYTLLIIIAAIVVTIGFIQNSPAVIIGAMVIAPMLGPVISIAFSSILGDSTILRGSMMTLLYAVVIVVVISVGFTFFFPVPIDSSEFSSRTHVNIADIVLAFVTGIAGALSTLNKLPGSLVGVMVAVALIPPNVVLGMTLGARMWKEAYGSMLLLAGNISAVILAGIIVFSLSGIRPVRWSEVEKAKTSRKRSILFVSLVIVILVIVILFSKNLDLV
ncbi:TIGR00341 family protein [Ornithinibacillus californiensis]|uniref:TIGR00341 family protein n=1 Tax=Ornithinibacillus californiensis TaxID=161536 RepID=UPI00064DC680|nr:TIGR00341 family protein [Ornithinibacillus californiensis]